MLFSKECKKVLFSFAFLIYLVVVFAMYVTQFHSDVNVIEKPVMGQEDYGTIAKEVPEILMPAAINSLVSEYLAENFTAYPYGFVKHVHLKEKQKTRMAEIIHEISGITPEELNDFKDFEQSDYFVDENGQVTYYEANIPEIMIPESLTYERFRELMEEADEIIGGGSKYSKEFIVDNFSYVPKTYDDALTEYEQFINQDKITGAYARLYCDYLGIILSILPVFVAAAFTNLDKKSGIGQLIYSRKISSSKLIFTRYFSMITILLIPVIITALIAHTKVKSIYPDAVLDNTAILRYMLFWLVPNIMTASAVGMLMTELTSGILAIFIQGTWWISSVFTADSLTGSIGKFTLVMRHNSLSGYDIFNAQWNDIIFNRIFFTVCSILAVLLTSVIYELKRRGVFNGYQINIRNFKNQSEA